MFDVKKEVKKIEKDIISWRRELHQIPELGLNLPKTTNYITNKLDEMGIEYKTLVNGNAVVGLIKGIEEGNTIALRADTDALPIKEETGLPFASTNGAMHACGHDGHAAMLLGAAKVLNDNRDKLKGNVKLLFQPGEEYPGGAKPMIEEGALENPKVDAVIGLHAGGIAPNGEKGKITVSYGPMMASMDRVLIKIKGKGNHGAYPYLAIDPIVIAAEVVTALQNIISRETEATEPVVLSICRISGGYNQNIIPDNVELEGTIRTFDNNTRKRVDTRIEEIVKGVVSAHRGDYEYQYDYKYPPLINDSDFTAKFVESAKKILPEGDIIEMKKPVMGGEDMAYFLEEVPGTFFYLSNPGKVDGKFHGHHSPKFDLDEGEFWKGTALFVQTVMDYLNEN